MQVFLYHCISDGNRLFSENFEYHFHVILHVMFDKAAFVRGALFWNLELSRSNSASRWQIINLPSKTPSKLFANHNALGQLNNHNIFCFSEGVPSSNPELIEPFVWGWGERYCNNVNYVKNNAIFEPPSMRTCSSTPPKQNQDFVKEHNRTPLIFNILQATILSRSHLHVVHAADENFILILDLDLKNVGLAYQFHHTHTRVRCNELCSSNEC